MNLSIFVRAAAKRRGEVIVLHNPEWPHNNNDVLDGGSGCEEQIRNCSAVFAAFAIFPVRYARKALQAGKVDIPEGEVGK